MAEIDRISQLKSRIELKTLENGLGGRDRLDFGTVRPRVQIPGPRPISEFELLFLSLKSAPIRGPHGFPPCAVDLAALTRRLCM